MAFYPLKGRELIVVTVQLSWKLRQPPQCLISPCPMLTAERNWLRHAVYTPHPQWLVLKAPEDHYSLARSCIKQAPLPCWSQQNCWEAQHQVWWSLGMQ